MKLHLGDCLEQLKLLKSNSIDSLVTDPPAGIAFMGKDWDKDKGGRAEWIAWMRDVMQECLRVLKPGAHGLVWALPRTSHWTATALEDAGFEVRDIVTHHFGSGFPKSMDVSKAIDKAAGAERVDLGPNPYMVGRTKDMRGGKYCAEQAETNMAEVCRITAPATDDAKKWQGFGTALKPASEHWILVRKPCSEKTVAANVIKWGCGAINVDASRVETTDNISIHKGNLFAGNSGIDTSKNFQTPGQSQGRFPANLILSCHCDDDTQHELDCAVAEMDRQSGVLKNGGGNAKCKKGGGFDRQSPIKNPTRFAGDSGGASRFFYVAKASKADKGTNNTHPTVKSQKLMTYLIRMVTPPGGVVLDPFMGSGSTGVAAVSVGYQFIGIEQDPNYHAIAEKRIYHALPLCMKQYQLENPE